MINKQNLLVKLQDNQIQGIIGKVLQLPIEVGGYVVENNPYSNYLELYDPEGKKLVDDVATYILEFTPELLDKEFNSILVGGLGLGVVPFVVQDFCDTIDIIEIDTNIININQQLDVLNSKVNVIEGDVFTFQPTKTYDIILIDVMYRPMSEEMTNNLTSKYLPFLNEGGFLYYPINVTSKENTTVIVNK